MIWLLQLLASGAALLLLSRLIPGVRVRSYGTAVLVAFVIGLLNATIGFLLRLPLNLLTLFLLTFIVRLFVSAIVIRITARLFRGFDVPTFTAAFLLALGLALTATLVAFVF